jgi:hypothetical protein
MPSFVQTIAPTSFGFFDSDPAFQAEADSMVTFVRRMLGGDVLSVELTTHTIWTCFELACCEYSRLVHETKITSELTNMLGLPTSSSLTNKYPRQTLEYLLRMADPYATEAYVGGSFNGTMGYFNVEWGRQDYDIYTELLDVNTNTPVYDSLPSGSKGKLKIVELFHFSPFAAQQTLLNASNITNFLATNFNYESYVNSTIFYVLPVFEDVLRRGMLETATRVRRSHYSYQILGSKLRIFPIPAVDASVGKMYCKVMPPHDPLNPSAYGDDSVNGISGPAQVPLDNIPYSTINQPGRQWIRQYTLALAMIRLGIIRSKMKNMPIPNADLQLDGDDLKAMGKEDREKLETNLKEFLANLTHQKLLETNANAAENLNKQLRYTAMPLGKAITIG